MTNTRVMCPHNISSSVGMPDRHHWEMFQSLYEDPLFRAFLPLPKEQYSNALYLTDNDGRWVTMAVLLSRLSSPVGPIIHQFDRLTNLEISKMMNVTNVAPLVLTGIDQEHQGRLNLVTAEAMGAPRRLILMGEGHLIIRAPMERIKSGLDSYDMHELLALPLESLGAVALKRFCRGEVVNGNFMKKVVDESEESQENPPAQETPDQS